jgi:hypothetical protein
LNERSGVSVERRKLDFHLAAVCRRAATGNHSHAKKNLLSFQTRHNLGEQGQLTEC